ncbi:MAG: hypothetical protein ACD_59C00096G0001 [uncultured bacterium]|nr:MAG: hypothetical protein ACD_59C00096G0001 [uncultured bacterium]
MERSSRYSKANAEVKSAAFFWKITLLAAPVVVLSFITYIFFAPGCIFFISSRLALISKASTTPLIFFPAITACSKLFKPQNTSETPLKSSSWYLMQKLNASSSVAMTASKTVSLYLSAYMSRSLRRYSSVKVFLVSMYSTPSSHSRRLSFLRESSTALVMLLVHGRFSLYELTSSTRAFLGAVPPAITFGEASCDARTLKAPLKKAKMSNIIKIECTFLNILPRLRPSFSSRSSP